MYKVVKKIEISASHNVQTSYDSLCNQMHGHNWNITIYCQSKELDENGMVEDFSAIKSLIHRKLDHKNLNEILPFNPTSENIAAWICEQIPTCYKVEVKESENNMAIYEKD